MSGYARDFASYRLGDNVYELGRRQLPRLAAATGYEGLGDTPTEAAIGNLIGHIAPAKWLQANVGLAATRFKSPAAAVKLAGRHTEQSGVLKVLHRSFVSPEIAVPSEVDTTVIGSGVARWMFRRVTELQRMKTVSGFNAGKVLLGMGLREMKPSEHSLVAQWQENHKGKLPTETTFANVYLVPPLLEAGFDVDVVRARSEKGDEIMKEVAAAADKNGTVMVVGNAPSTIQSAGEFRLAARSLSPGFDAEGDQLFMASDSIPLAWHGEPTATHQNPLAAIGQVARDALYLYRNAQ